MVLFFFVTSLADLINTCQTYQSSLLTIHFLTIIYFIFPHSSFLFFLSYIFSYISPHLLSHPLLFTWSHFFVNISFFALNNLFFFHSSTTTPFIALILFLSPTSLLTSFFISLHPSLFTLFHLFFKASPVPTSLPISSFTFSYPFILVVPFLLPLLVCGFKYFINVSIFVLD